ncbi:DUF86 domain-containing protein [candidate division KSB1 bacterium]|nr:DUF86 domain-containing protein [candidate division KSB1 bacterium]
MSEKDRLNILSILEAIDKISDYTRGYSDADEFYANQRDFDASMMNFIVIGEMVLRLSEEFVEKYNHIDWHKIRGFRNIVAHNYFGIDAEEVWEIIQIHLPKLNNDLNKVLETL